MEFYYYEGSRRNGPFNASQLRSMASAGIIKPWTDIEVGGKTYQASRVKGLVFGESIENTTGEAVEPPVINNPDIDASDLAICSDWSKRTFEPIEIQSEKSDVQKAAEYWRGEQYRAADSLDTCCDLLRFFGWIELIASVVVAIILFVNAEIKTPSSYGYIYSLNPTMIAAGVTLIIGGIVTVTVNTFVASIGHYVVSRDNAK